MRKLRLAIIRRRGIAMVLVLFTVAVVFILGFAFASAQSVSVQISRNITARAQARMIAEAGLEMAIAYVEATDNWRSIMDEGAWVEDKSFAAGTLSIYGNDGEDTDGDGVIEGDGDLADSASDPVTLTVVAYANGGCHKVRSVLRPQATMPSAATSGRIYMKDTAVMDSFDSSLGPYGGANVGEQAVVSTNSTEGGKFQIKGAAVVKGDALVGPGGDPEQVIIKDASATITGSTGVLDEAVPIPTVTAPEGLGPSIGDVTYGGGGTFVLTEDVHATKLKIENGTLVQIQGNVTILCEGDFNIVHDSRLEITPGSRLTLYGKTHINVYGTTNFNDADPSRLLIYNLGETATLVKDTARLYATIISPNAELAINTGANFYGKFLGRGIEITGSSGFHQDRRAYEVPGVQGGSGGYAVRWCESP